ncbi:GDP-L-fucose synthase [Candidatus Marithrix sp. Canyon 246]|uniref:GDP-L-fucose synthase n=1 Tax=Candidatus Marithrix sp. Canyon 246 TaxID=1827136 RepID=UPI00084A0A24|nr:GDP-L-fucose synthase [Candidatus Marithrix sp. Canyon 246]
MIPKNSTIYIAGHRGMVGSALLRKLDAQAYQNIITQTHSQLDLTRQADVDNFFQSNQIDYMIIAAAKVGGIHANNTYPAEFIYHNLMIEANLINAAYQNGVEGLLFLGSSCIYPKFATQPMAESELLTGSLEPTNEPYAIAKIAGIKLCESYNRQYGTNYRSVMPTNLYGPNDNFNLENSHVIPALIRKFHEAKLNKAPSVSIWGSGNVRREFLYVDDMAEACFYVMQLDDAIYSDLMLSHLNIGTGVDISICELAELIKTVVEFDGEIVFDVSKPEGPPRKLLDTKRLTSLGWQPKFSFKNGLAATYQWYLENY